MAGEHAGTSVSALGDVTGDGLSDLAIGAPTNNDGGSVTVTGVANGGNGGAATTTGNAGSGGSDYALLRTDAGRYGLFLKDGASDESIGADRVDLGAVADRRLAGLTAALETGNNLSLPKEDFIFILEDVGEEIAEEPGFDGFSVPIDKKGARLLTTVHNKLVNTHTEDLKHWWKIFHAAKEDWTVLSENWEGTSWGYFTGDDEAMKVMTGRIYEQMQQLDVKNLLWPE
mgnify:CR=1 FL=1